LQFSSSLASIFQLPHAETCLPCGPPKR
jgi:hypothetical protein